MRATTVLDDEPPKVLDDLGCDLNKPMTDGATPSFIAAANGQVGPK